MINRFHTAIGVLLAISIRVFPQEAETFPVINADDLPGAILEAPRTFNGSSLYGYMDGGADLYLEYGFTRAWVNEVNWQGGKYTIELYKMNSPEDAFGIFSVSRYRCKSTPALTPFTCQAKYQLQIVAGQFYINIINSKGTSADSLASLEIGKAIVRKVEQEPAEVGDYMPDIQAEVINRNAILVKGELGLRNGAPDLLDLFKGITGYRALILQQPEQILVSIKFDDKDQADVFFINHGPGNEKSPPESLKKVSGWTAARLSDNQVLITSNIP